MGFSVKCNCQHCDGHIEFDSAGAGQTVECPHCQMETLLYVPPPPKRQDTPRAQAGRPANPNLIYCPSCKGEVSIHAETCPKCGHTFKSAAFNPAGDPVHLIGLLIIVGFIVCVIIYIAVVSK